MIFKQFYSQFLIEWRGVDISERKLKHFGWLVGGIFAALALWYQTKIFIDLGLIGIILVGLGSIRPWWLKAVYVIWMRVGIMLGFIVSRLLLTLIFVVIITPLGLLRRLVSGDTLGRNFKIYQSKNTFWIKHE